MKSLMVAELYQSCVRPLLTLTIFRNPIDCQNLAIS